MTHANGRSRSLTAVLGTNCRRIRTDLGLTQDTLAAYARAVGLPWNAAKVANFEAGRWTPTFADVLTLGIALERARTSVRRRTHSITLADLLAGSEPVSIRGNLLTGAELHRIGRGASFPAVKTAQSIGGALAVTAGTYGWTATAAGTSSVPALAEQRLARTLGIDPAQLAEASKRLWGTTFTAERDRRAGAGNQQRKGRVSRELRAELEKALVDGDD